MSCTSRLRRWLVAGLVALSVTGAIVAENPAPARAVGADDSIVGPSRVSSAQIAAWFRPRTRLPYRAGLPLDQLASLYISEGQLAGVRGDIAFTQSVVETAWFSFPAGGKLTPEQNNFAGIGACDSCPTGLTFASVQLGIRAQMQQLRRYADPYSRSWNIGAPPVQPLWPDAAAYDVMNRTHGWAPTWQSLSGTWASSLSYAASINLLYNSLWNYAGRPGEVHWFGWELPGGFGVFAAGGLGSGPTVASWQAGRLDVFATGADKSLVHKWWDGQSWSPGWENLSSPPTGPLVGRPAATSWGPNRIDVFARGSDDQLWTRAWNGAQWGAWATLGGVLTAAPAVASRGSNQLDVFVNGSDHQLWKTSWSGTGWSGWSPLGGVVVGTPAAVAPALGKLDLFVRGDDDALYHKALRSGSWSPWASLGGKLASGPAASSWGTGRIDVFVRGTDHALWHLLWGGIVWSAYESLGGVLTSDPSAISWAPGRIDVFARGTDMQLWHRFAS